MAAEKLGDDHGAHVLAPTMTLMDVFPELITPVECGGMP